jgi:hypothetical protein
VDSPSQQTEGPWHDWLLTLVPRSWLLRKPSLELARLLAARARKLLEYPRGAGIETSASAALAAAGSALEKLWSELKVVDSGNDDERWPLLEDKLSGQLSGELEERLRQKPHPPNRKGTRNTRPGKLQQKTPSRTGRTRSRHDTHGGRK